MAEEPPSLTFFVAHPDAAMLKLLANLLEELGHQVIGTSQLCKTTLVECALTPPDIILSGLNFPDGDAIETLIVISERKPVPAIVVTEVDDVSKVEHAMDDHVMSYLIQPVTIHDLKPTAIVVKRRFDQMEELKAEVDDLKSALENRKKLERAKGLLMDKKGLTEEAAYLEIRDLAKKSREKIGVIAQVVIDTYS